MVLPTLPDADKLVLACFHAAVPGVTFGTQIPTDLATKLPFAVASRFGGATVDPRFLDRASVDVQTWANTREGAFAAAYSCRNALRDAWLNGTVFAGLGHIAFFSETSAPSELRTQDQSDALWRTQATYSVHLRPL